MFNEVNLEEFLKLVDVGSETYENLSMSHSFNTYEDAITYVNRMFKLKSKY
ncbi:Uncharacterised protein [Staphylococcus aureus]|nr:Uncharacterised protein [Staphylococcus aureus]